MRVIKTERGDFVMCGPGGTFKEGDELPESHVAYRSLLRAGWLVDPAELAEAPPAKTAEAPRAEKAEAPPEETREADGEPAEFPRHIGRGTYELSNGNRVKGKAAAQEAQAALGG